MKTYVQTETCTDRSYESNAIIKVKKHQSTNSFGSYETEYTDYASQSGSNFSARDDCETSRASWSADTTEKIIEYCLNREELREECDLEGEMKLASSNAAKETVEKTIKKKIVVLKDRTRQLYNFSRKKQIEGRQRRDAIAIASWKRNYIRPPESYGVLQRSRCDAMYRKGMNVLKARDLWRAQELKMNQDLEPRPRQYGKLPASMNNNMFVRGTKALLIKESKRKAMQKSLSESRRQKKLPPSLNDNMYRKSIKRIKDKEQYHQLKENRHKARKVNKLPPSLNDNMYKTTTCWLKTRDRNLQNIEQQRSAKDPRRISSSKASEIYDRGQAFMRAKQMRILEEHRNPKQNGERNKTLTDFKDFQMIVRTVGPCRQNVEVELLQHSLSR